MKKIIYSLFICLFVSIGNALTLNVNSGTVAAKPIAIVPFANNFEESKADYIVSGDLKQSGIFAPISPIAYSERPSNMDSINYSAFQALGASYVVTGTKKTVGEQQIIQFVITDTFQERVVGSYTVKSSSLRNASHQVSDIILQKLTGTRGAFATKLAYIYESGVGKSRRYQIMLSDSDGYSPTSLISSVAPLMSPRFSPDGNKIAYVTFEGQHSQIVVQNIQTGRRSLVSKELGINSSPAWSPDGSKIAMVLSKDGNPEVYIKNITTNVLTRVTNNPSIDTEPVWSKSGGAIYFTSNRNSSPQLYKINISNGRLSKVSNTGRYSAGADISDDGKKIALSRNNGGKYIVGTININTGRFKGVSNGFTDETPRFSPNGTMLIFTSVSSGREILKIVNVDGSGENTLSSTGHIRDPDWSTYTN